MSLPFFHRRQSDHSIEAFIDLLAETGIALVANIRKIPKRVAGIVDAITEGMYHPSMKQKLTGLEARKAELTALLAGASVDKPDLLPSAASIYASKVAALADAPNQPEERPEPAEALRMLIEKIVLTPELGTGRDLRDAAR